MSHTTEKLSSDHPAVPRRLGKTAREIDKLLPGGPSALAWGLADCGLVGNVPAPLTPTSAAVHAWIDEADAGAWGTEYAISALAWCWRLPQLADLLPADDWWALLDHLIRTAKEAGDKELGGRLLEEKPLLHQLLAGELPLTLSLLLPKVELCRALRSGARAALSAGPIDLLDGEGLPHARYLGQLRPLLACWTRCLALGATLKNGCWNDEANQQYRWLAHNILRLSRRDGSHVFSTAATAILLAGDNVTIHTSPKRKQGNAVPPSLALRASVDLNCEQYSDADLLQTALELGGNAADRAIAAVILPDGKKKARRPCGGKLPEPAVHSEWAATAVLRPDWSRSAPRLTVLYPDSTCQTELACGKDVLWSGTWQLEVRIDGVPVPAAGEWQAVCWVSDEDIDYLELEIDLDAGLRVQRHILLARKDRFVLLADAVLGTRPAKLEYRGILPLGTNIKSRQPCDARETTLVGRKPRARVLPLALPEWKADSSCGELAHTPAGLELRQAAEGCSLFAPLFFDLDRRRIEGPLTWRRLSVAASLAPQPPDVAVGYRVAAAKRQWLIYRSLAAKANRTLLGHNVSSELLAARFAPDGEVQTLVEID